MKKQFLTATTFFLLATTANATESESSIRLIVGAGGTLSAKNSVNTSGMSISVNGELRQFGIEGYGGFEYRLSDRISFVNTLGYHVREVRFGSGQKVRLTSIPFNGIVLYSINESIRLGAGVEVSGRGKVASSAFTNELNFKTSPNALLQAEYLVTPEIGLSIRYVIGDYKLQNGAGKVKADHAALLASFYF